MNHSLDCAGRILDLRRPVVMGILNITPDSFSDGGQWLRPDQAVAHAVAMAEAGAAIIDVGGESTRPGADDVAVEAELERVIPVIEALAAELDIPVSVDTSKPRVITEAARAGAGLVNDVYALRREGALEAAAATGLPVCLMHMQGEPRSMQSRPEYTDVVDEVRTFLLQRAHQAAQAGIPAQQIVLDPGFGFGKTVQHNLSLLKHLGSLVDCGYPVLAGLSRKSMLATLTGREVHQRLAGSLALALAAAEHGAHIIRVHDVADTADVLKVLNAVQEAG